MLPGDIRSQGVAPLGVNLRDTSVIEPGSVTPKALRNTAQGCRAAATLGAITNASFYPEGVALDRRIPCWWTSRAWPTPSAACGSEAAGRNPFRVETGAERLTQGSRCAATLGSVAQRLRRRSIEHGDSGSLRMQVRLTRMGRCPGLVNVCPFGALQIGLVRISAEL